MNVTEKYGGHGNLDYVLKRKIYDAILHITDNEINEFTARLCKEIRRLGIGEKINNTLEYKHSFYCRGEIEDYIINGAKSIVDYALEIHIKQIVLFRLMNSGILMPVSLQSNVRIELDLNHSHGNTLFDLVMDILPYNQFLIIQMPTERFENLGKN